MDLTSAVMSPQPPGLADSFSITSEEYFTCFMTTEPAPLAGLTSYMISPPLLLVWHINSWSSLKPLNPSKGTHSTHTHSTNYSCGNINQIQVCLYISIKHNYNAIFCCFSILAPLYANELPPPL